MNRTIAIAIGLMLIGCIPSLHPLYTDADLVFDPALLGTWMEKSAEDESWTFTQTGKREYELIYTDGDGKPAPFIAHLISFDGRRFLDLYPSGDESPYNGFYQTHLVPAHTFMHVAEISPTLRLAMMNPAWLDSILTKHPKDLAHEREGDAVIITASTSDLQEFVLKHLDTPNAWGEQSELRKGW
ncbi:MAG: hypothetical protein AB1752_11040 [Candidatus Zixiibacteriota bacterium]